MSKSDESGIRRSSEEASGKDSVGCDTASVGVVIGPPYTVSRLLNLKRLAK
jgi:hypothetical protein